MNFQIKAVAALVLCAGLVAVQVKAAEPAAKDKKATATKTTAKKKAAKPTVEEQLQQIREEFQGQINGLKSDIASKDAQLQKAQADATAAQAEAARANAAASEQQQAISNNAAAVGTLDATVKDLKANEVNLTTTISDETTKIKKSIESPSTLHYKGITLTPGGFVAAETVFRTKATGGDIPTAFSGIPYESADAYSLSEFYGSARQSRLTLLAEGKTSWGTLRGYYEADFLGTGITSNNNQSNSYVLRQRVLYASAETASHWTFAGGQLWSLTAENKKGITIAPGDIASPQTIDPNYVTGFVWTRQYGFRVIKNFKKGAFAFGVENPQALYSAALSGDTPYAVLGSAGANGGNYNAAISGLSGLTSYVKQYNNVKDYDSLGNLVLTYAPVYNTIAANSNITNISFNQAPDVIAKVAIDPGWGHYEIFGIGGFEHETVYPGVTQNSVKYGGVTDIQGYNGAAAGTAVWASSTTAGYYTSSIMVGGFGGSMRAPLLAKNKLVFGAKALYGPGVGRYGNSTLSDVTNNAAGQIRPIHNFSGLLTLEANPTPRLSIYFNYGGDYAARADYGVTNGITLKDPTPTFCSTVSGVFTCTKTPGAANFEGTGGAWGSHFTATPTYTAVGYGSHYANNSACTSVAAPGYNSGGSTGYLPGGSCGANTRDVQEFTGGYWYDIYKGDKGRLRQGVQYGYAVREGWSGNNGTVLGTKEIGAKGIDNMFWTSFRYYLP
jgi:Skp family chaperone for outer membrane proteins